MNVEILIPGRRPRRTGGSGRGFGFLVRGLGLRVRLAAHDPRRFVLERGGVGRGFLGVRLGRERLSRSAHQVSPPRNRRRSGFISISCSRPIAS